MAGQHATEAFDTDQETGGYSPLQVAEIRVLAAVIRAVTARMDSYTNAGRIMPASRDMTLATAVFAVIDNARNHGHHGIGALFATPLAECIFDNTGDWDARVFALSARLSAGFRTIQ